MSLSYVLYKSHALIPSISREHRSILEQCQRHNGENNVTGFLHREGDCFIQYLEGPRKALQATMKRIKSDPRHDRIEVLDISTLEKRHLSDWQMGFATQDQISLGDLVPLGPDGDPDLTGLEPFDLVGFVVANAHALHQVTRAE